MMASGKSTKKSRPPAPVVTRRQGPPWLTIGAVVVVAGARRPASSSWCSTRPGRRTRRPTRSRRGRPSARQPGPVDHHPGHLRRREHPGHRGRRRPATSTTRPPSTSPPTSGWPTTGTRRSAARTTAPGRTATASSTPPRCAARTWCTPWSTAPSGSPTTRTRSPPADLTTLKALVKASRSPRCRPYPGLDSTVSLQAWAHQLKVDSATDERVQAVHHRAAAEPLGLPGDRRDLPAAELRRDQSAGVRPDAARRRRDPDVRRRRRRRRPPRCRSPSSDQSVDATAPDPVTTAEAPARRGAGAGAADGRGDR